MSASCSDVCEAVHETLSRLGFLIDPDSDDHDDILEHFVNCIVLPSREVIYLLQAEDVKDVYEAEHGEGSWARLTGDQQEAALSRARKAAESFFGEHWHEVIRIGLEESAMSKYVLRFARMVILEKAFEAESQEDAEHKAMEMEEHGLLLVGLPENHAEFTNVDVQDYEPIWEVEEVG